LKENSSEIQSDSTAIMELCGVLLEQLNSRFSYVDSDPLFLIAAFLDPATCQQLKTEERSKAEENLISMVLF